MSAQFYGALTSEEFLAKVRALYERARQHSGGRRRFRILVDRRGNVALGVSGTTPASGVVARASGRWPQPADAMLLDTLRARYARFRARARRSVLDVMLVFRGTRSARLFVRYLRDGRYGHPLVELIRWSHEEPLPGRRSSPVREKPIADP